MPNSINVPLLLANIIRSQYRGSEVSEDTIPYNGIWLMTKKIKSVKPVHISFWLKGTFVSGCCTSGRMGEKGLMRSRNRTAASKRALLAIVLCERAIALGARGDGTGEKGTTHGHSSWRYCIGNLTDAEKEKKILRNDNEMPNDSAFMVAEADARVVMCSKGVDRTDLELRVKELRL